MPSTTRYVALYWIIESNISASFKVPKNTVASIIHKWKHFGTTKTLPRADRPAKLSNQGRRGFVRVVTKNPMVTLTELQSSSVEMLVLLEGSTPSIRPLW